MNEYLKYYSKTKVILKIFLLYIPFVFLLTWFNWFISTKLIGIIPFYKPFIYSWYQNLEYFIVQYVYVCIMSGLIYYLYKAIKKNKDFFLM